MEVPVQYTVYTTVLAKGRQLNKHSTDKCWMRVRSRNKKKVAAAAAVLVVILVVVVL